MGDVLVTSCTSFWDMGIEQAPQVALRVVYAPIESAVGTKVLGASIGDDIQVTKMDRPKAFAPLQWRYEMDLRDREAAPSLPSKASSSKLPWPDGYRFRCPKRYWRISMTISNGAGCEEQVGVLQVSAPHQARSFQLCTVDVEDSGIAASYALRFNRHSCRAAAKEAGVDDAQSAELDVPSIRIAAPVACEVVVSSIPQLLRAGDFVNVYPYSADEVRKFVFEGNDDFVELPQAYFHYTAWSASGKEYVADLQGIQTDEGDVLLLDPVVLRSAPPTVGDLISSVAPVAMQAQKPKSGPCTERFDLWHPKCGQMCKSFDPQRRGGIVRTHCGIDVATCM